MRLNNDGGNLSGRTGFPWQLLRQKKSHHPGEFNNCAQGGAVGRLHFTWYRRCRIAVESYLDALKDFSALFLEGSETGSNNVEGIGTVIGGNSVIG